MKNYQGTRTKIIFRSVESRININLVRSKQCSTRTLYTRGLMRSEEAPGPRGTGTDRTG